MSKTILVWINSWPKRFLLQNSGSKLWKTPLNVLPAVFRRSLGMSSVTYMCFRTIGFGETRISLLLFRSFEKSFSTYLHILTAFISQIKNPIPNTQKAFCPKVEYLLIMSVTFVFSNNSNANYTK